MPRLPPMALSHAETQAVVLATIEALENTVELAARTFPAERRDAVAMEVLRAAQRWAARVEDDIMDTKPRPKVPIPVEDATAPAKKGRRRAVTTTLPGHKANGVKPSNGTNGSGHTGGH